MRTIGVVTAARSDYGIYLPLLQTIKKTADLQLRLFVTGMHLSPEFGLTVEEIEADKFDIDERVEMLLSSDTPEAIAKSIGMGVIGFSQVFARSQPDILVVLGDRFEMLAAALAAMPYTIPIAHIHGGETTEGAMDEFIRHALTKMSHLHFVSTEKYRERILQMGEEPWRVTVCGAPALDNLHRLELLDVETLEKKIGLSLEPAPLLVTYHPVTLEYKDTPRHISGLLAALEAVDRPILFTYPNADTSGREIIRAIEEYVAKHKRSKLVVNLGTQAYFSLMKYAAAMVGNSSSGIIEAASFGLPVVNIGSRQRGRVRGANVIDADYKTGSIMKAIQKATSADFRSTLKDMENPYGTGHATQSIVDVLRTVKLDHGLILKPFQDFTAKA
ncbi:MAG: UDP-N-acetylglucosamine 2-epimerase (hydrolyzing) [Fidelibacterota bacterium]|nr:MAG: UDP-N-acetylglucosamine 2-epimerase (hydrolyzing) [Candidatus Neomarinimicrobiota bacterium]